MPKTWFLLNPSSPDVGFIWLAVLGKGHKAGRPTEKMHFEKASEEMLKVGGKSLLRPSKGDKNCKDLLTE